jgi:hypothetical protein
MKRAIAAWATAEPLRSMVCSPPFRQITLRSARCVPRRHCSVDVFRAISGMARLVWLCQSTVQCSDNGRGCSCFRTCAAAVIFSAVVVDVTVLPPVGCLMAISSFLWGPTRTTLGGCYCSANHILPAFIFADRHPAEGRKTEWEQVDVPRSFKAADFIASAVG